VDRTFCPNVAGGRSAGPALLDQLSRSELVVHRRVKDLTLEVLRVHVYRWLILVYTTRLGGGAWRGIISFRGS
jgi:hypothetical protein